MVHLFHAARKHTSPLTFGIVGFVLACLVFLVVPVVGSALLPAYPRALFYMNSFDEDYDGIPPFDDAMFNGDNVQRRWECVLKAVDDAR